MWALPQALYVKIGTIFESSHVLLHKWLQAIHLLCSSKKGISSHQLHRLSGVTLKTAWFMGYRIREAMRDGSLVPLGSEGSTVDANETYFGLKEGQAEKAKHTRGPSAKRTVVGLVERDSSVRTFHVERADKATIGRIVRKNVELKATLMTDESWLYAEAGAEFVRHETVAHAVEECGRGEAHTNTIEGYFSFFKRGVRGVYQHCREKHLHHHLAEFNFLYDGGAALGIGVG